MRFGGRIYLDRPGSPGLAVTLTFQDGHLSVAGQDEALGSWSLTEVGLQPLGDGRFHLLVGDDQVLLVPEDPLELEYQVMPVLDAAHREPGVLGRLRSWMDTQLSVPLETVPAGATADLGVAVADRPQPPADRPRCEGRRRDGDSCRSPVVAASGYCFAHDPARAGERRRRRAAPRLDRSQLQARLARALEDLRGGRLDPATATAMAHLVRVMHSLLQAEAAARPPETDRPDGRIEAPR